MWKNEPQKFILRYADGRGAQRVTLSQAYLDLSEEFPHCVLCSEDDPDHKFLKEAELRTLLLNEETVRVMYREEYVASIKNH